MTESKSPVFVFVHGAWHTPACFSTVRELLSSSDYTSYAPALPSVGCNPPAKDFEPDVQVIRTLVSDLVTSNDVVVVMHSYGGIPGGEALKDLDKTTRAAKGLEGGVIRLVYIMAFLVPEGFQATPVGTGISIGPGILHTDLDAGILTIDPSFAQKLFYQDIPAHLVEELAKDLRPQSTSVFWSKTTYAAWRAIPTTYVLCKRDTPAWVKTAGLLLASAKASGQHRIDTIIEHDVGHSPFISQPEWTAKILIEAGGMALDSENEQRST